MRIGGRGRVGGQQTMMGVIYNQNTVYIHVYKKLQNPLGIINIY